MELQQILNLITGIIKQTVGLQYICRKDFILNMKGKQCTHFPDFWRYDNIALNQRNALLKRPNPHKPSNFGVEQGDSRQNRECSNRCTRFDWQALTDEKNTNKTKLFMFSLMALFSTANWLKEGCAYFKQVVVF